MKAIGYIAVTIALLIYGTVLNGWALSKLWSWFIVTSFSVPPLSIPAAIGFALVVYYLTHQIKDDKEKEKDSYAETLVKGAILGTLKPLFVLGFGAIVRLWL